MDVNIIRYAYQCSYACIHDRVKEPSHGINDNCDNFPHINKIAMGAYQRVIHSQCIIGTCLGQPRMRLFLSGCWDLVYRSCNPGHSPDSKVHGAYMGPTWGRKDPGVPHVGPMNLAIREVSRIFLLRITGFDAQACWPLNGPLVSPINLLYSHCIL